MAQNETNLNPNPIFEQPSLFESLMSQIEQFAPELGGVDELGAILALPDESFAFMAPVFLGELQKAMNNMEDKMLLVQTLNLSNIKLEDVRETYNQLIDRIDTEFAEIMTAEKRSFLKRMIGIIYNCIAEVEGIARRVINVPIELTSEDAKMPTYANLGDGAVDLYAPKEYTINPGETVIIPVDIKVALPYGYAFLIHPRSGLSAKTKLRVANSIGLIDSQYKGTIGVIIENVDPPIKDLTYEFDERGRLVITSILHGSSYTIGKGERFAQMRLVEVPTANFFKVDNIMNFGDDRGGGFGSSGTN